MKGRADARDQILHSGGPVLMDLLPFTALGCLGLGFYRRRRPASPAAARLEALGTVFLLADGNHRLPPGH